MTDTAPLTDQQLADRIEHALRTTSRQGWGDHRQAFPAKYCTHAPERERDGHSYDATCALCVGDVAALTAALLAVVQPELDRLRAEREDTHYTRCWRCHHRNSWHSALEGRAGRRPCTEPSCGCDNHQPEPTAPSV